MEAPRPLQPRAQCAIDLGHGASPAPMALLPPRRREAAVCRGHRPDRPGTDGCCGRHPARALHLLVRRVPEGAGRRATWRWTLPRCPRCPRPMKPIAAWAPPSSTPARKRRFARWISTPCWPLPAPPTRPAAALRGGLGAGRQSAFGHFLQPRQGRDGSRDRRAGLCQRGHRAALAAGRRPCRARPAGAPRRDAWPGSPARSPR